MRVLEKADRIIAVSEATAKDLGTLGVSPAKITVIPNGVDRFDEPRDSMSREVEGHVRADAFYLLHVGGIDRRKNVNLLPAVLRRARAGGLDLDLVFAGRIEKEPEFLLLAGRPGCGVEKNVRWFLGYVPDADLSALYAGVGLWNHRFEGFGLPVLEAMAAGAPVVASNRGAIPEVVRRRFSSSRKRGRLDALGRLASEVGLRGPCWRERNESPFSTGGVRRRRRFGFTRIAG